MELISLLDSVKQCMLKDTIVLEPHSRLINSTSADVVATL